MRGPLPHPDRSRCLNQVAFFRLFVLRLTFYVLRLASCGPAGSAPPALGAGIRPALGDHAAVAPLPLLEVEDRFEEVPLAEVRPEGGSDPDLAVSDLPEEEVGHAHLAARPDQQIGIGNAGGAES